MTNRWANATDEQRQKFKEAVSKWKKKMRENFSKEERAKHIKQLKINAEKWRKNKSEEAKKRFKEKMSNIMRERWKDSEYKELKRKQVSEQMKTQWASYTEEEKETKRQDIKNKAKKYRESLTEEEKKELEDKMYQWRVAAAKEREKRGEIKRPCQYPQCILWAKADSDTNLEREKLFLDNWFSLEKEFPVWNYLYDFKIGNTLIEINPYAWHNSTWAPSYPWAKPKDKLYHYNKAKNAIDNWYEIIEVWDWISKEEVLLYLKEWKTFELSLPRLNRYNPKNKKHIIDNWHDRERMIEKWYIEIRDCWF